MIYSAIVGNKDKTRDDIKVFKGEGLFKSPRMEAKIYKVLFHKFIDAEKSIWIDGNVFLQQEEEWYYDQLGDYNIGVVEHPKYGIPGCIYKEAEACKRYGQGNPDKINEQISKYRKEGYPERNGLGQCCMIVRKNTKEVRQLCEAWWAEICRHSVRDQISFPYIFRDKVKYFKHEDHFPEERNYIHDNNKYFKREPHLK